MLTKLYCKVVAYMKSEEGATAIEYGLLAALIAIAIIAGAAALGGSLNDLFNNIATKLTTAGAPVAPAG